MIVPSRQFSSREKEFAIHNLFLKLFWKYLICFYKQSNKSNNLNKSNISRTILEVNCGLQVLFLSRKIIKICPRKSISLDTNVIS